MRNQLLRKQYADFDDRVERRDLLGDVAEAVFDAFNQRPIPAADLVGLIDRNGAERHLMLWSNDPTQEAAWEELGVSGVLPADALMLSLINRGGNKLDPYMELHATLTATDEGDHRRVTVTVDLDNTTPDGLPRYVQGPYDGIDAVAGRVRRHRQPVGPRRGHRTGDLGRRLRRGGRRRAHPRHRRRTCRCPEGSSDRSASRSTSHGTGTRCR